VVRARDSIFLIACAHVCLPNRRAFPICEVAIGEAQIKARECGGRKMKLKNPYSRNSRHEGVGSILTAARLRFGQVTPVKAWTCRLQCKLYRVAWERLSQFGRRKVCAQITSPNHNKWDLCQLSLAPHLSPTRHSFKVSIYMVGCVVVHRKLQVVINSPTFAKCHLIVLRIGGETLLCLSEFPHLNMWT
jgi:hypothetical protein